MYDCDNREKSSWLNLVRKSGVYLTKQTRPDGPNYLKKAETFVTEGLFTLSNA